MWLGKSDVKVLGIDDWLFLNMQQQLFYHFFSSSLSLSLSLSLSSLSLLSSLSPSALFFSRQQNISKITS